MFKKKVRSVAHPDIVASLLEVKDAFKSREDEWGSFARLMDISRDFDSAQQWERVIASDGNITLTYVLLSGEIFASAFIDENEVISSIPVKKFTEELVTKSHSS